MVFNSFNKHPCLIGLLMIVAYAVIPPALAGAQGSVCFRPGNFDSFAKGAATAEAVKEYENRPHTDLNTEDIRFIQIDKSRPVKVTSSKAGKITGLDTVRRHTIKIAKRPNMKEPVAAFSFSFRDYGSDKLCLWYKGFYASWVLQSQKGNFCRC
jgi:hypothetical protein